MGTGMVQLGHLNVGHAMEKNEMDGLMAGLLKPFGPKSWPIIVGRLPWAHFDSKFGLRKMGLNGLLLGQI